MWPFTRKKSLLEAGVLRGWTDWHSHILPGVDDGVRTLEESLEVLHWYESVGIREVWLTPHIMEDIPNTPAQLRSRFAQLKAVYHGPVVMHLAAEHMLDPLFEERLESGEVLPITPGPDSLIPGSTRDLLLLVETSYFNPPIDLDGLLRRIREKGYTPLLAHPERYMYMGDKDYERLAADGVLFQLNLPSLAGAYGPEVRKKAERLLRAGRYAFSGSDLHRLSAFRQALETKVRFSKDLITSTLQIHSRDISRK